MTDRYTIRLPLPHRALSPNGRANPWARNKAAREAKELAMFSLLEQMGSERPTWSRARLHISWNTPEVDAPSTAEIRERVSCYVAGIVLTGLVPSVNALKPGYVMTAHVNEPGVTLTVEAVE